MRQWCLRMIIWDLSYKLSSRHVECHGGEVSITTMVVRLLSPNYLTFISRDVETNAHRVLQWRFTCEAHVAKQRRYKKKKKKKKKALYICIMTLHKIVLFEGTMCVCVFFKGQNLIAIPKTAIPKTATTKTATVLKSLLLNGET